GAGIAVLAPPDARLRALRQDCARDVAEDVTDGEGAAAKASHVAFDDELLAMLRGAAERAFSGNQRRALLPLAGAGVFSCNAGPGEQAVGGLVAPAEVGGIEDDAGGIAVAPLDHHLVPARQRHVGEYRGYRRERRSRLYCMKCAITGTYKGKPSN